MIFEDIVLEEVSAHKSVVVFNNCEARSVEGIASNITINGSKIHGNDKNGIFVKENSKLKIKDTKVYQNGTKGKTYPQIVIENSEVNIENSEIYDSKGGDGIYVESSPTVKLQNVKTLSLIHI